MTDQERARFLQRVEAEPMSGCHLWMGAQRTDGYGEANIAGNAFRAHRVAYEIANGPFPLGTYILHSCDNRLCVNPTHLRAGTAQDNSDDMKKRGRSRNGSTDATHCKNGHEYTEKNTGYSSSKRRCRTCVRDCQRRSYLRKKAGSVSRREKP